MAAKSSRASFFKPRNDDAESDLTRQQNEQKRQQEVESLLAPRKSTLQDVPIDRIRPNPFQARRNFDKLAELVATIKAQGFTSRLRVRPDPAGEYGYFQLVYGERRLRAAKEAGLTTIPCEIAEHSDAEMIEIGLAENIQRRDLKPLEEAQAFQTFIRERGYTIRSLAERIGKDKNYVDNRLALLRTPEDVQEMVAQRPDTIVVAREIAKLPTAEARKPIIEGVVSKKLPVREVKAAVQEAAQSNGSSSTLAKPVNSTIASLENDWKTMQLILARWQTSSTTASDEEYAALKNFTSQLVSKLTSLNEKLTR